MLEKITSFITGVMVAIGGFFTPTPVQDAPIEPAPIQEESFGAFSPVAGGTYRLKTSIGTSDTTIILSAFTEPITGNPLTMTSLATDIGYATIDPQSSTRKEFVSFTGITQNADGSATLTGVSRGLGFQSPFTASSTLRKSHPGQSIFILSDSPQLFNEYAIKRNNETITGQWTFTTFPITPSSSPATATTTGVIEFATGAEAASSTLTGDIGRLALGTDISTSSAPASGNVVVVTGDDGNIAEEFIPNTLSSGYSFTATTTGISKIEVFTSSSTWTKPTGAKLVDVFIIGGGGGGTSGSIDTGAGTQGGGGGGGGGISYSRFSAAQLTATATVTVGSGGAGGTAVTSAVTVAGNNGSAGTASSFGSFLNAAGGSAASAGTGGAGGGGMNLSGGAGGNGSINGGASTAGANTTQSNTGGGGGGSTNTNGSKGAGSAGGSITPYITRSGGTAGDTTPTAGGAGSSPTGGEYSGGTGGGGGGANSTNLTGASGGNGGTGGGGGGGAGSYRTAGNVTSGAGGRGGNGLVVVITY